MPLKKPEAKVFKKTYLYKKKMKKNSFSYVCLYR